MSSLVSHAHAHHRFQPYSQHKPASTRLPPLPPSLIAPLTLRIPCMASEVSPPAPSTNNHIAPPAVAAIEAPAEAESACSEPTAVEPSSERRLPLAGKVAIVTGSSRSIGASIAKRLAEDGADVIINYHRIAVEAERTAYSINAHEGGRAYIVKADVSTVAGGKHLLAECVRLIGAPDIVVLNAGIMGHKSLEETEEEDFDALINTNVKGPLFLVQAASEVMTEGASRICLHSLSRRFLDVRNFQEGASSSSRPRSRARRQCCRWD